MESLYFKLDLKDKLVIDTNSLANDCKGMVHDITCQICLNIVYPVPVSCSKCYKMFCKTCIDEWKVIKNRCPNGCEYEEAKVNQMILNLLNKILLSCSIKGCTKKIYYEDYLKHIDMCESRNYQCKGCNLKGSKTIIASHVNLCDEIRRILSSLQ
jgi:hypothetical protein